MPYKKDYLILVEGRVLEVKGISGFMIQTNLPHFNQNKNGQSTFHKMLDMKIRNMDFIGWM